MVEADRWKALLRELDEYLCEGIADHSIHVAEGGQPPVNPTWLRLCLNKLRAAYPVDEQNYDSGIPEAKNRQDQDPVPVRRRGC